MANRIVIEDETILITQMKDFVTGKTKGVIELPTRMVNPMMLGEGLEALSILTKTDKEDLLDVAMYRKFVLAAHEGNVCPDGAVRSYKDAKEIAGGSENAGLLSGVEAIEYLISKVDLEKERSEAREIETDCRKTLSEMKEDTVAYTEKRDFYESLLAKARKTLDAVFLYSSFKDRFYISEISVFPLTIRPIIDKAYSAYPYETTTSLSDAYGRILRRAKRLRHFMENGMPEPVLYEEGHHLQKVITELVLGSEERPACLASLIAKGISMV